MEDNVGTAVLERLEHEVEQREVTTVDVPTLSAALLCQQLGLSDEDVKAICQEHAELRARFPSFPHIPFGFTRQQVWAFKGRNLRAVEELINDEHPGQLFVYMSAIREHGDDLALG